MKKYISLLLLFTLGSCSTPLKFQISKPGEEPEEFSQRIVYSLPRTVVKVDLKIEKESYFPGPYYQFTERLLGLEDYISKYGFQYKITGVDIETFTEPDPDMFYSVNIQNGSFDWERYLILSEKGFVMDPAEMSNYNTISPEKSNLPVANYFKDLSTNLNLTEVTDTLFKTIITDTSLIRLPVVTTARKVRTLEQKAEEAAKNLFTLRENRFFLISNTEGDYPDGQALGIMVSEMDKMERAYVELFTGKVTNQKYGKSFLITPEDSEETYVQEIGSFSTRTGLAGPGNALPIRLEITPLKNFAHLDGTTDFNSKGEAISNLLYYRIPDYARIRVLLQSEVLYEGLINVYQFGGLINVPVAE